MVSRIALQPPDSTVWQKNKVLKIKPYKLRNRVQNKNLNVLPHGSDNVETMCKLLCKPMSINITKLSVSELNRMTKSKSCNDQLQDFLMQEGKHKSIVKIIRKDVKSEKEKCNSGCNIAILNVAFSKAKKSGIKNVQIQGLIKNMKQPYIKLHRIDEAVNKIVQSFVKTIPHDKCETCVEPDYIQESQVELKEAASKSLQSSTLNRNEFNSKCVKDHPSQSVTANSHINQTLQSTKYAQDQRKSSDSSKIHIVYKRKIISDSISHCDHDDRDSEAHNVMLQEKKRLKLNSSEGVPDIHISNKVQSVIEAKCINENQTVPIESCQKLSVSFPCDPRDKNLNSQESTDMFQENSSVFKDVFLKSENGDNMSSSSIKKDNTIIYMVPEANTTFIKQDKTECKEIHKPMQQSIFLDKCIVEKYKILKELRVLLIRLDSFRRNHGNNYSAIEIEQLDTRMKYLMSFNLSNKGRPAVLNYTGLKAQLSFNLAILEDSSAPNYSCTLNNKIDTKGTQNTIKPSSVLQRPTSMFIEQEKRPTKANIEVPNTCHNLTGHFEDVSEKNSKQSAMGYLKQESVVSPSIIESTLQTITQQCPNKSLELLCAAKDTIGTKESVDVSNTSFKNINVSKEGTSKILLSKANYIEDLDSQAPEKLTSEACKLLQAQEHEIPIRSIENMQVIKLQTSAKKGITISDCSIISPQKHVKSIGAKGTDYKCIVCDQYFKNYFNLQQHLIIHSRKRDNNSSDLSRSTLSLSEKLRQTRFSLPASEMPEFTQPSELKTTMPKRWWNEDKKRKDIKGVNDPDSNKCSIICSQILSISSDSVMSELLKSYKFGKQNLSEVDEGKKNENSPELKTKKTIDQNSITNSITYVVEESSKVTGKETELFTQDFENRVIESTTLSKENSSCIGLISNTDLKRQKRKKVNVRRTFKVCHCHNRAATNKNCLQIEIVLVCHICGVLFRTMECFQTHYHFPKHVAGNENGLNSWSPNLFCTSCGMIFSSVQDVRHHLEIHARFNKSCTAEFRCNVCKVMFIGIGSLFYIHWSTHAQDPFWIASEQSFPKNSIMTSKFTNINKCDAETTRSSNTFVERYLLVAEYVCQNCKLPFVSHNELQQHITSCNVQYFDNGTTVSEKPNLSIQTNLPPQLMEEQKEGFLLKHTQTMDSTNKVCSTKCNSDKEKLIRILGGSDDVGYEFQIDLTESFEECDETSELEEIEQIQLAIKRLSDADTWIPTVVENFKSRENMINALETNTNDVAYTQDIKVTDISQHVRETVPTCSQNLAAPISAHNKAVDNQINAGVSQVSSQKIVKEEKLELLTVKQVANVQGNIVYDTALMKNEKESSTLVVETPAKQQSPQKPRVGYLRVKPLAELIGHTQMCENQRIPTVSGDGREILGQNVFLKQFANCIPETNNSKKSSMDSEGKLISLPNSNRSTLLTSSTSTEHQRVVNRQIAGPGVAILRKKQGQLPPKINQNTHSHSHVQNEMQTYSKSLPSCNMFFLKQLPSTTKTVQNYIAREQYDSTVIRQPTVMHNSSVCYQYPHVAATNSNKGNQMPQQIEPRIVNHPVAETTSASTYYKNTTILNGGISMVINQTAPTVQNISMINMLQLPANQQIYQAPVYNDPLTAMNNPYPMQSQVYLMWQGT